MNNFSRKIFGTTFLLNLAITLWAQEKTPFQGIDQTWQNGADRRDSSIFKIPYFTPTIILDLNYNYSFENPIDHTVVGSTVLARHNELQLNAAVLGGDFYYNGVSA